MSIVTLPFFIFTGITVALYWACFPRLRWLVLLAASGCFLFFNGSAALCAVFAAQVLAAWLAALAVARLQSERLKTLVTALGVLALGAALIWFKDLSFFVNNFNRVSALTGLGLELQMPQISAPFGVSYYSLMLISYLLDVRWGKLDAPERNPLRLLLFAGYFPQMTSGPISRYGEVAGSLFGRTRWDLRRFQFGLQRFLWGLFKKLVLADRLAVAVSALYDGDPCTGLLVVVAAFLYIAQLYADFSGCMDIILGVSELFGVELPENFRRPFAATDLSELWRRWHMTLGLDRKSVV